MAQNGLERGNGLESTCLGLIETGDALGPAADGGQGGGEASLHSPGLEAAGHITGAQIPFQGQGHNRKALQIFLFCKDYSFSPSKFL